MSPECEICTKNVKHVYECEECGVMFCKDCGSPKDKICFECSEEPEEEDRDWEAEEFEVAQKDFADTLHSHLVS